MSPDIVRVLGTKDLGNGSLSWHVYRSHTIVFLLLNVARAEVVHFLQSNLELYQMTWRVKIMTYFWVIGKLCVKYSRNFLHFSIN